MGNMHLVTGYQGKEHVTAADHGSLYAAIFGGGSYVLDRGNKLAASMITSNQVRIADGDMVIQGRHARLNEGATVDLTIESGAQGQKRNDLVVARYTRNASSGVEEVNLVVIKGTPATSDPTDPAYANGDILTDHAETVDFPLYRIPLDGITVGTPVRLFDVAYLVTLGSDKKVPAEYLPSMDYIPNSKRGAANGVAPLNSSQKVDDTYLPSYIPASQKGVSNGVATLNASGKLAEAQRDGWLKVATGTYTGTGKVGSNNKNSLSFNFEPYLVIISRGGRRGANSVGSPLYLFRTPATADYYHYLYGDNKFCTATIVMNWETKKVSWYATDADVAASYNSGTTDEDATADQQFNTNGNPYYYVAFGV